MRIRRLAWVGALGSAAGAVLGLKDWVVGPRVDESLLSYPAAADEVWWTAGLLALVHAGAAAATWAVARSRPDGGASQRWLAVAAGAFVVMVPAELAYLPLRDAAVDSTGGMAVSGTLGACAVVAGLGLTVAGVQVVRAGRWSGWRRPTVLAAGLWPLVVVTPVFLVSGWAAWPLVGWQVLLTGMAAAVLAEDSSATQEVIGAVRTG
jgi:hypothetical protein